MNFKSIYNRLRHPGETLSERVVHGGFWILIVQILERVFGLIKSIILARLLAPNDFGLFGIAMLALSTLESFSLIDSHTPLVQKKENIESYLNIGWTIHVLRGLILAIILAFGAPLVGSFFGEPKAIMLVRVLAAGIFVQAFQNIGIVYFKKELEFHKFFAFKFSGTFANIIVSITAAFILRSVWALIYGFLASEFIRLIVSYIIHPYRPRFSGDLKRGKEIFDFSKFLFLQSIVVFLLTQGDDAFVGKILGATALGFYRFAYRLSNLPATGITHLISRVTFPAYSKIQDDKEKLKQGLKRTLNFTSIISIPLASGIFILAPEFTRVFLGSKWMPMVPAMQVMCLFGAMRSIADTFDPFYMAIGKPHIPVKIKFTELLIMAAIIYPFSKYLNIFGTSIAITLSLGIVLIVTIRIITKILETDFQDLFKFLLFVTCSSIGMILTIWSIKTYLFESINPFSVIFLGIIGVATFVGLIYFAHALGFYDLSDINDLRSLFRKVRRK
jgi:lipopolysaccharide exporter